MKKLYILLFSITLVLLLLPGIQTIFPFVKEKPLNGVLIEQEFPRFSFHDWFSSKYQPQLNTYFVQHFGFRPFLTRLYNQIDFILFKKATAFQVVVGKNDYLFEKWFIDEYYGSKYFDIGKIDLNINRLSKLRNELKECKTELLVLLVPGKSYIYPEHIPSYLQKEKKVSIYETYSREFQLSDIPYIDLNNWFMRMKDTVPFPLFPKTGTHWSGYGSGLIMDSIIKKVEQICDIEMDHFFIDEYKLVSPDNDLEKLMNLFTSISNDSIVYPIIKIREGISTRKPNIIVIGDSFFWTLGRLHFSRVFRDFQFWYYYKTVFNGNDESLEKVEEIDIFSRIALADIVIIMQTTTALDDLGWGCIDGLDNALETANVSYEDLKIQQIIEEIKFSPEWLNQVNDKAIEKNISLDSMLYLDAKYLYDIE